MPTDSATAGVYNIGLDIAAAATSNKNGNYSIVPVEGTLTINPNDDAYTFEWADPDAVEALTYTGSALEPVVKVTYNKGVTGQEKVLSLNTDYTVAYENNTSAGTAKATIAPKADDTGKVKYNFAPYVLTFTINPKLVKVTPSGNITKVYDGTTAVPADQIGAIQLTYADADNAQITGIAVDITNAQYASKDVVTAAGNKVTLTYGSVKDETTGEINTNFKVDDANSGKEISPVTITPKPLTLNVTVADKVYDGNDDADIVNVTLTGVVPGDDAEIDSVKLSAKFAESQQGAADGKNVGKNKTVNILNVASAYTGSSWSNYSLSDTCTTTATIAPAQLTIVAKDQNKAFGTGDTVSMAEAVTIVGNVAKNASGAKEAIEYTLKYAGNPIVAGAHTNTEPGQYEITVVPTDPSAVNANYDIATVPGTMTINPVEVTMTATNTVFEYDDERHGPTITLSPNVAGVTTKYTGLEIGRAHV